MDRYGTLAVRGAEAVGTGVTTGVQVGDRIVTSGHGGVFPMGIPVGIVAVVDGESVIVRPHFDWNRIEYLRLIDYRLPGILGGRPERGPEAGP